jgi:hypothetical protein
VLYVQDILVTSYGRAFYKNRTDRIVVNGLAISAQRGGLADQVVLYSSFVKIVGLAA